MFDLGTLFDLESPWPTTGWSPGRCLYGCIQIFALCSSFRGMPISGMLWLLGGLTWGLTDDLRAGARRLLRP